MAFHPTAASLCTVADCCCRRLHCDQILIKDCAGSRSGAVVLVHGVHPHSRKLDGRARAVAPDADQSGHGHG